MRYAQIRFKDEEEFFELKKAAMYAKQSLEEFIKQAVEERLNSITEESIPQSSLNSKEKSNV